MYVGEYLLGNITQHREPSLDQADVLVLPTLFFTATPMAIKTGLLTNSARGEIVDSVATLMLTHTSHHIPHAFTVICQRLFEILPETEGHVWQWICEC